MFDDRDLQDSMSIGTGNSLLSLSHLIPTQLMTVIHEVDFISTTHRSLNLVPSHVARKTNKM